MPIRYPAKNVYAEKQKSNSWKKRIFFLFRICEISKIQNLKEFKNYLIINLN